MSRHQPRRKLSLSYLTLFYPLFYPDEKYVEGKDGLFYKLHRELKNWTDAKNACERENANLAMEKSDETHEYVATAWSTFVTFWIGVYYENKTLMYVDGTTVTTTYWNWPHHVSSNKCIVLDGRRYFTHDDMRLWNKVACDQPRMFLCQKHVL